MKHIIYEGTPSLPYSFQYTPTSDAPMMIYFSGTAWTNTENSRIGLQLLVNGSVIADAMIFSNTPAQHRALQTGLAMYTFPFSVDPNTQKVNPVTIEIQAMPGTNFDVNDFICVACFN